MSLLHATEAEKSPAMIALDAEIKENVLKGIAFLKKTYGEDWVEHIDMEILDLRSGASCVLGQVHPAYYDTHGHEDGYNAATDKFLHGKEGREFGFSAPLSYYDVADDGWDRLQEAWEEVIPNEKRAYERKKAAGLV